MIICFRISSLMINFTLENQKNLLKSKEDEYKVRYT